MATFELVNYEVVNRVARIAMNRPEARNAFNSQLRLDLAAAISEANADDEVRVLVIAGEGKGFCAGHDLADGFGGYDKISETIEAQYKPFLLGVYDSPKLCIASVQGAAAGIGAALSLCCDFTVMAESSYLYQAFLPIGLVPDGGASWHLVRSLGYKRAMQLVIEAEKLPAQQCVELGLANKVMADDKLAEETQAWAEKLASGAPIAQRLAKQLLQQGMQDNLVPVIEAEAKAQDICSTSEDTAIAVTAFFNKTTPVFTGR